MALILNGDGTVTGLAVGGLPDGTVDKDTLAVGVQSKVLQVVQGTTSTLVSNSTQTYADTGLTATITPISTTSKILVVVHHNGCRVTNGNINNALNVNLLRDAVELSLISNSVGWTGTTLYQTNATISTSYLDSPATTSALTYKTQFKNVGAAAAEVTLQLSGTTISTITLMEIGV